MIGTKCTKKCRPPSKTQAHCSVCHQTFGSVTLFDLHRQGFIDRRVCLKPQTMKLIKVYGVWDTRDHAAAIRKRVEAMHEARS